MLQNKYRQRETDARSQPVDQLPDEQQAGSVSKLKSEHDVAVAGFRPAKLQLQGRFQQTDHLPVHVIHRGCEKQQAADQPARVADGLFTGCPATSSGTRDGGMEVHWTVNGDACPSLHMAPGMCVKCFLN